MAAPSHKETAGPVPVDAPPLVQQVLHSSGQPLDESTRDFFEAKFGHDLGNVRLHTGSQAAKSAQAVNASAYTVGSDVVFGAGSGPHQKPLLAHELAHVVQQNGEPGAALATEAAPLEAEAERASAAISGGSKSAAVHASSAPRISRQPVLVAPAVPPALSFLTPQDITKLQGFGNADYQASLDTLDKMLRITGDVTQDGLPRQFVSTRQSSGELRTFLDFVRNPDVRHLKVVPSASGGRSPDFYYRHASGAEARVEAVNITAAAKSTRATFDPATGARNIPRQGGSVVNTVEDIDTVAKLREAIRVKVKAGSQLSAQNPNTQAGGQPMQVGGEVRVSTSHVELSRSEIDGVVRDLQSDLANSSASKIVVDTVDSAEPRAGRKLFEFTRNPDGTFSYSETRMSYARPPGAAATTPAGTGAGDGPGSVEAEVPVVPKSADLPKPPGGEVKPPVAEIKPPVGDVKPPGSQVKPPTGPASEVAPLAEVKPAAIGPVSTEAGAAAAEFSLSSAILGMVVETAIFAAIALALQWVAAKLFEAQIEEEIEDILKPAISAKMQQLQPTLMKLAGTKKLMVRITYDFIYQRDSPDDPFGSFMQGGPPFYEPGSMHLVNVHPGNEELDFPSLSTEMRTPILGPRERVTARSSYSVLLDDAPRRLREKQMAEIVEKHKLKQAAPPRAAAPPAPPSAPPIATSPAAALLPPLAPQQAPPEFNPLSFAPGPSPTQEIDQKVEAGRNRCLKLIAYGEKLQSSSRPMSRDRSSSKPNRNGVTW